MTLTRRQRQVAVLVAQARTDKEIATELGITSGSVKVFVARIYALYGMGKHGNSRVRLARLMWRDAEIQRCDREIARCEQDLREGKPEMEGLLLGLMDWANERRLLLEADNG